MAASDAQDRHSDDVGGCTMVETSLPPPRLNVLVPATAIAAGCLEVWRRDSRGGGDLLVGGGDGDGGDSLQVRPGLLNL